MYGWAKDMERRFGCRILDAMLKHAGAMGIPASTLQWDEYQVNVICLGAVRYCMAQKCYAGEFDHLKEAVAAIGEDWLKPAPAGSGVNIADPRDAQLVPDAKADALPPHNRRHG